MPRFLLAMMLAAIGAVAPAHATTWIYPDGYDSPFWRVVYDRDSIVKTGTGSYAVNAFALSLRKAGPSRWAHLSITCPVVTATGVIDGSIRIQDWRIYDRSGTVLRNGHGIEGANAWFGDGEDETKLFDLVPRSVCPSENPFADHVTVSEPFPFARMQMEAGRRKLEQMSATLAQVYAELIGKNKVALTRGGERLVPTGVRVANCDTIFTFAGHAEVAVNSTWFKNARAYTDDAGATLWLGGGMPVTLRYLPGADEMASDGLYALEDAAKWSRTVAGLC